MTPARRRRLPATAWVFILVAIGGVQYFRGAWIDGTIFFVVAAVLIADLAGAFAHTESARKPPHPALVLAVVAVLAAVLLLAPRHGILAGAVLAVVGAVAVVYAWNDRRPGESDTWTPATVRSAIAWSIAGVVTCLWELTLYILGTVSAGGRSAYPAFSDLVDPLLDVPAGRLLFVVSWLLFGVFLMRRLVSR